jgi:hypothetical protein
MRMAAPTVLGRVGWVVVRVIVQRHIDRRARGDVAVIFLFQRVAVIFKMVEDIERAVACIERRRVPLDSLPRLARGRADGRARRIGHSPCAGRRSGRRYVGGSGES